MKQQKKLIWCDQCKSNDCHKGYVERKPEYCRATADQDITETTREGYLSPEIARFQLASSRVIKRQKEEGVYWPRIQESIEFVKEINVKKVGIAVCASMMWQGAEFAKLMKLAGLEPCMVNCLAGGMGKEEMGIPEEWNVPPCNPIVQAEILNREGTEFNFIYGLCIGHDTLFIQHSKAPVSVFLVKDRVTINNPGAALFSYYHRNLLRARYGAEPDNSRL